MKNPSEFEAALAEQAEVIFQEYLRQKREDPNFLYKMIDDKDFIKAGARWARAHTLQSSEVQGLVEALKKLQLEVSMAEWAPASKPVNWDKCNEALAAYDAACADYAVRTEGK